MGEGLISPSYGAYSETLFHPIVAGSVLVAGILIFLMRPKYAVIPILFIAIFTPMSQRVVIGNIDFMVLRILILLGWIRLLVNIERKSIKLNVIDKVLILWVISNVVSYTLLWQSLGAFINRLGYAYDVFGIYFLFRFFILNFKDIDRIIKTLVLISSIVALCMVVEQATTRNFFSIFGGVPEITPLREGHLRSQGAFRHPIMAGLFGATLMPLFISLWWHEERYKKLSILGFCVTLIITLTSSSSGPVIAYIAGIIGLYMWYFRKHMRIIRWGILSSLITLHLIMEAPVWALVDRVGIFMGSSSYHRFRLLDQFIKRVDEWWLVGTKSTDHWGWMMWDHANQYVAEGTTGGLLSLLLFIAIIVLCFRAIGLKIKTLKGNSIIHLRLWAFGSAIFANVVAFMGAHYFDQIVLVWYMLLAMISTISTFSDKEIYIELQNQSDKSDFIGYRKKIMTLAPLNNVSTRPVRSVARNVIRVSPVSEKE